ncbi:MAG: tRNA (adenosine(37)-N6)-threonylcarbamoyltransferase complex dimerization subunit type 1 TsaB [Bacteroidales bacterium]|nr:tRNA (adenosine(37)-N6)-threonylcarbamoyltransferase complex dimerization subunit type 1 TsaB [Bacteroidales bacterium]
MTRILLIETSAALCSVALGEDGRCVAYKESDTPRSHASMTAVLVDEILKERGLRVQDCDAVCVSKGPGSYTGLRVGVSSAKGLCFGAGLPLLAVGTLDLLVQQTAEGSRPKAEDSRWDAIIPVIDARRDEVYTAVFKPRQASTEVLANAGRQASAASNRPTAYSAVSPVRSLIVGKDAFDTEIDGRSVLFIGDAAEKCQCLLQGATPQADTLEVAPAEAPGHAADLSRCRFIPCQPRADAMAALAQEAFNIGKFEDVAYFEPFYLKDFVATTPKKKLF